jgi:hypothetical protein
MAMTLLKVTPRLEERINARWLYWSPWMVIIARKRLPFVAIETSLHAARAQHRQRYIDAMSQNLREVIIKRRNLDDPRLHQDEYRIKLHEAIRRSSLHKGKQKGVRRTHKEILKGLAENV